MSEFGLFDLFKEVEPFVLKDGDREVKLAFKALDYVEQQALLEALVRAQSEAVMEYETPQARERITKLIQAWDSERRVDMLIVAERGTALQNAHLASGERGTTDEEKAAHEKAVLVRWERERREELATSDEGVLISLSVTHQVRAMIANRANAAFIERAIVASTVHPDTLQPALSSDPSATNYVGRLMPITRGRLVELWTAFNSRTNEKQIREQAEGAARLSSGGQIQEVSPAGSKAEIQAVLTAS